MFTKPNTDQEIMASMRARLDAQKSSAIKTDTKFCSSPSAVQESDTSGKHKPDWLNKLKEQIRAEKAQQSVKGNGHKPEDDIPNEQPANNESPLNELPLDEKEAMKSQQDEEDRQRAIEDEIEEKEYERQMPGYGYLTAVKDKHLPQSTVLDKGQVLTFALGYMQEDMLNPERSDSLFVGFAKRIMRMNISVGGLGREQILEARQQDSDKGATLNMQSDLRARP